MLNRLALGLEGNQELLGIPAEDRAVIPTFLKTQMSQISTGGGEFCSYHPNKQLGSNCLVSCGAICTFCMIFLGEGGVRTAGARLSGKLPTGLALREFAHTPG